MDKSVRIYLAEIGRRSGRKSRRTLDSETARAMVRIREARRAYRKFHARCFWSYPPDLEIGADDVDLVLSQAGFIRSVVSRGEEATRIDWARDSAWRPTTAAWAACFPRPRTRIFPGPTDRSGTPT